MTDREQRAAESPLRGGIDIERYAEVMAHVRHFGKTNTPEVLERLGLDEDRWEEALFGFTAVLAEESEREEEALSKRFGERFAKTKTRLGKEKPALASIGPRRNEEPSAIPVVAAPVVVAPVVVAAPPAPAPSVVPIAPTPLQSPLHQAPAPVPSGTSPWARSSNALPMAAPPLSPPAPVVAPPAAVAAPPIVSKPEVRDMSLIPAGMRNFRGIHGTEAPSLGATSKPALPFAGDAATAEPEAALQRALEHAQAEPIRPKAALSDSVTGETKDISAVVAAVLAQKKPVPFERDKPASPKTVQPVAAPIASPKTVQPVAVPAPAPVVAAPAPVVASAGSTTGRVSTIPEPPKSEPIPLTLEQYASLCVEIAQAPAKQNEIAQRYGLSEEKAARVDAYWRGRIANEPEIDNAFRWAYHSYQQWLMQR